MSNEPVQSFPLSRVRRTKEEARATYDRISGWYDALAGAWEAKATILGLQKLAAGEDEMLLEIGGGTGHSVLALARCAGKAGVVCDLDLSPRMLEVTGERLAAHGMRERVLLLNGDAVRLPYADETFDAVFMSFVLELFDTPEIPLVLRECRRVLRTRGRICVVSLSRAAGLGLMGRLYEWGHNRLPAALDCRLIYVERALCEAGFTMSDASTIALYGLAVEVALAHK